jgi:hypothetical protein
MAPASEHIQPGARVLDKRRGRERLVHDVQLLGRIVKLWLKDPQTGVIDQVVYPESEVVSRFQVLTGVEAAFGADSIVVGLVAECHRLEHAYLFNPVFATETSLIDALPHHICAGARPAIPSRAG